jgi:hypothetical protein
MNSNNTKAGFSLLVHTTKTSIDPRSTPSSPRGFVLICDTNLFRIFKNQYYPSILCKV